MQDDSGGSVGSAPMEPWSSRSGGQPQSTSPPTVNMAPAQAPTRPAPFDVGSPPPPPTDWKPPVSRLAPPPPPPPPVTPSLTSDNMPSDLPVPVVQALSVRGVEYTMMTLTLWFAAGALLWAILALVNGATGFEVLSFPISLLIVCVPIFSALFIRLRRAELANPALRFDASKRRLSQFTQVFAFATCLFNLIGFVYLVVNKIGGESSVSLGKAALNLLIVLVVAGGVLTYYWFDEHRLVKR